MTLAHAAAGRSIRSVVVNRRRNVKVLKVECYCGIILGS